MQVNVIPFNQPSIEIILSEMEASEIVNIFREEIYTGNPAYRLLRQIKEKLSQIDKE